MIVDAHLLEDRRFVYAWMVCPGGKEEGEFRRKQERIKLSHERKLDEVGDVNEDDRKDETKFGRMQLINFEFLITGDN